MPTSWPILYCFEVCSIVCTGAVAVTVAATGSAAAIGWPQPGQTGAISEICRSQAGQGINAMLFSMKCKVINHNQLTWQKTHQLSLPCHS